MRNRCCTVPGVIDRRRHPLHGGHDERAHHGWLGRGEPVRAARAAFWVALRLGALGERARSSGWAARCEGLLAGRDCEECGYLLLLGVFRSLGSGDLDATAATSERILAIGTRFANPDLVAFAKHFLGQVRARRGEVEAGLRLLDEAMVAATAGELHPILTGLVYCKRAARRCTRSTGRGSGPRRSPPGATPSRSSCRSPAAAWCTGPSC
jgi:hypothetical protein